ncbi:MAG: glycosyltransferase family 1 protein [Verrucomicrobia bacterium]|nr:MAG: glycosyltransferase family 1 protein [Verrucomicrobiota bacterium]
MIALSFSFSHHGRYSAYHRLLNYLRDTDYRVDATLPGLARRKIFNPRGWTESLWRCFKEREAFCKASLYNQEWVHYLYPEQGYFRGNKLKSNNLKIAMSCHLPYDTFERYGDYFKNLKNGLSLADALILMSPDDLDFYSSIAPNSKTCFIPHGVDTHHFKPILDKKFCILDRITILTCGGMLRDFDTLVQVIEIAASRKMPWKFVVVTGQNHLDYIFHKLSATAKSCFVPLTGLDDRELLDIYHKADLLYLPLLNATANNAVLESMSCGLPMILSDFPATRAYAADTAEYLNGRDPDEAFNKILSLAYDVERLKKLSLETRVRAVTHLSWEVVVNRQISFLND